LPSEERELPKDFSEELVRDVVPDLIAFIVVVAVGALDLIAVVVVVAMAFEGEDLFVEGSVERDADLVAVCVVDEGPETGLGLAFVPEGLFVDGLFPDEDNEGEEL
jgi:hypothetical protein